MNNNHITAIHAVPASVGIEWFDKLYKEYHFDRFDLSRDITEIFTSGINSVLYMVSWMDDISMMVDESGIATDLSVDANENINGFLRWISEKVYPFIQKGWVLQDIIFTKSSNVVIIYANPYASRNTDHRRSERYRCHISETM